ncbi:metallophosphoesterase, partial [Candidatus Woesearchaeota archaeon]|nr:metallophosphoesterase [Candidatus Woesearchaeota archaeon]
MSKKSKKKRNLQIGVVADLHGKLDAARNFAKYFLKHPVDAIVLNGDLSEFGNENSVRDVLRCFSKIKCPIYVIPGSHESKAQYDKIKDVRKKNVVDCNKMSNRKQKLDGYDLVFLPGSDFLTGAAQFKLLNGRKEIKSYREIQKLYKRYEGRVLKFSFLEDLFRFVKNPEKTIIISHVPPLFNKLNAIDVARFGKVLRKFKIKNIKSEMLMDYVLMNGPIIEPGHVFTADITKEFRKHKYPVKLVVANRGNKNLATVIKMLKVTKMICGHFHESGRKGNDCKGKFVKPNKRVKELFYNPGPGFEGNGGIYAVHDGEA